MGRGRSPRGSAEFQTGPPEAGPACPIVKPWGRHAGACSSVDFNSSMCCPVRRWRSAGLGTVLGRSSPAHEPLKDASSSLVTGPEPLSEARKRPRICASALHLKRANGRLTAAAAAATILGSSACEQAEAHHAIPAPISHDGDTGLLCRSGTLAARPRAGTARAASPGGCWIRHNPHWQLDHSCRCSVPRLKPLPLRAEEVADRGTRSGARAGFPSFPELRKMEARGKQSEGFSPWRC